MMDNNEIFVDGSKRVRINNQSQNGSRNKTTIYQRNKEAIIVSLIVSVLGSVIANILIALF